MGFRRSILQSFVRDMLIDSEDLTIVEGVIGLAKAFGKTVVAEGVSANPKLTRRAIQSEARMAASDALAHPHGQPR